MNAGMWHQAICRRRCQQRPRGETVAVGYALRQPELGRVCVFVTRHQVLSNFHSFMSTLKLVEGTLGAQGETQGGF